MKQYLSVVVFVLSFLSVSMIFPQDSWSQEKGIHLCSACKTDCAEVIEHMPAVLECASVTGIFGGTCEVLIGESGVGTALCIAGAVAVENYCEKVGWPYIKNHSGTAAGIVCKSIHLCL